MIKCGNNAKHYIMCNLYFIDSGTVKKTRIAASNTIASPIALYCIPSVEWAHLNSWTSLSLVVNKQICLGQVAQNILSVRNFSPNWQQFPHVRHKTIFKLIFKKVPKLETVGLPGLVFRQKKEYWF